MFVRSLHVGDVLWSFLDQRVISDLAVVMQRSKVFFYGVIGSVRQFSLGSAEVYSCQKQRFGRGEIIVAHIPVRGLLLWSEFLALHIYDLPLAKAKSTGTYCTKQWLLFVRLSVCSDRVWYFIPAFPIGCYSSSRSNRHGKVKK